MGFRIRPPKGLAFLLLIIAVLVLFLTGCASNDPQNALTPVGPVGQMEAGLFTTIFWIAVVVFIIVEALLLYTVFRFRRRPGNDGMPAQTHGNTALELTWTIIPVLILVGIAVPTLTTIASASNIPTGPNALKVGVVGHQWWWEFDYPSQGVVTADELHLPVGTKVALTIQSADVIHSFWVPKLGGKMQAIPNQVNQMWLQADEIGTFDGQCYQLCGTSHANMRFKVIVQSQADFDKWMADQKTVPAKPTAAEIAKGYQVFTTGPCVGCHTIEGTDAKAKIGPNLTHFGSRTTIAGAIMENNPQNLAKWLEDPPAVKPGSLMPNYHLTKDQVTALVAYLESLK
ncbi:MAG TPA: cytochrome c oxidase subunit II [Chloroflexota bacterium]|nr:cytochrome c oxidase subunit II [Chloroflexota bacterium]